MTNSTGHGGARAGAGRKRKQDADTDHEIPKRQAIASNSSSSFTGTSGV